jgi:hypothetical protein
MAEAPSPQNRTLPITESGKCESSAYHFESISVDASVAFATDEQQTPVALINSSDQRAPKEQLLGREWIPRRKPKQEARLRAEMTLKSTPPEELVHLAFDLSFEGTMDEGELTSMAQQLMTCQHANLQSARPFALHLCSFIGRVADKVSSLYDFASWVVETHTEDVSVVAQALSLRFAQSLVSATQGPEQASPANSNRISAPLPGVTYLSPDGQYALQHVRSGHVYIIGGIVDHKRSKGMSLGKASTSMLQAERLPLKEYAKLKGPQILTITSVFGILQGVSSHGNWEKAITDSLPKRYLDTRQDPNVA